MSSFRLVLPAALALALSACSGSGALGGLGPIFGNLPQCDTGTQVQLANPAPFQNGVSSNIGQITIVANGNSNTLYNTYGQWSVVLEPNNFASGSIQGGSLSLVDGRSLNHPFNSDFYYGSSVPSLQPGVTWNVKLQLNNGTNCTPAPVGTFST
jgi:hypothetical protein